MTETERLRSENARLRLELENRDLRAALAGAQANPHPCPLCGGRTEVFTKVYGNRRECTSCSWVERR